MPWVLKRSEGGARLAPRAARKQYENCRPMEELGAELEKRLQLQGIFYGVKKGKMPNNDQIDVALNSIMKRIADSKQRSQLSLEGQKAAEDLLHTMEAFKILLLVKNEGDLLQDLVWATAHASHAKDLKPMTLPVGKNTAKMDAKEMIDGLKTLAILLLTNGQFRKLLHDSTILLKEIASDAAGQAAVSLRPSEEEIAEAEKPVEEGETVWHEEPQKLKFSLRRSMKQGSLRRSLRSSKSSSKVRDGSRELAQARAILRSRSVAERTKAFLAQKIPKERREQKIWRVKRMIVEIQGHPDYQKAVETLIGLAEDYAQHIRDVVSQTSEVADDVKNDSQLRIAARILKTLLENFANYTSADDVIESIQEFVELASKDAELKAWLAGVNLLVRDCLLNHGHVLEDSTTEAWTKLYDQARYLFGSRYLAQMEKTVENIQAFLGQFDKDQLNKAARDSLKQLVKDLNRDDRNGFSLRRPIRRDLKEVVLPSLAQSIGVIPIPRIEVVGQMFDIIIEDVVIQSPDFLPTQCELALQNRLSWSRRADSQRRSEFRLTLGGLQAACKDARWALRHKRGGGLFNGTIDIALAGDGLRFEAIGGLGQKSQGHLFRVRKVNVDASNLAVLIHSPQHRAMIAFVRHIATMTIRSAVEKYLERKIKSILNKTDDFAYAVHQDAQDARRSARVKSGRKPPIYRFYFDALRRHLADFRAERKRRHRRVKTKFVFATRDSMLQHVKASGPLLQRADVYQDYVKTADRWKCRAFTIGSEAPTADLPYRPPTMRRPGYHRYKLPMPGSSKPETQTQPSTVPSVGSSKAKKLDLEFEDLDLTLDTPKTP